MSKLRNSLVKQNPRLVFLKVKIKSLASEAAIIRHEENLSRPTWKKYQDGPFIELKDHRRLVVRPAARTALLAYAYLRHKEYHSIEKSVHEKSDIGELIKTVKRFSEEHAKMTTAELARNLSTWMTQT